MKKKKVELSKFLVAAHFSESWIKFLFGGYPKGFEDSKKEKKLHRKIIFLWQGNNFRRTVFNEVSFLEENTFFREVLLWTNFSRE